MTLDQLRADIRDALYDYGLGRAGTEETVGRVELSAREYAAAQVEAHARPGPWPLRRPDRLAGPRPAREAS